MNINFFGFFFVNKHFLSLILFSYWIDKIYRGKLDTLQVSSIYIPSSDWKCVAELFYTLHSGRKDNYAMTIFL